MSHARRTIAFAFALAFFALAACVPGNTGDSCHFDSECQSSNCSFGICDSAVSGVLGFYGLASDLLDSAPGESVVSTQAYSPPYAASSVCSGLSLVTCLRTPGCSFIEYCAPPVDCWDGDAENRADCIECLYTPGCPAPCQRAPYCQ